MTKTAGHNITINDTLTYPAVRELVLKPLPTAARESKLRVSNIKGLISIQIM